MRGRLNSGSRDSLTGSGRRHKKAGDKKPRKFRFLRIEPLEVRQLLTGTGTATSTTTLEIVGATEVTYGQAVTLAAQVADPNYGGTPSGNVEFWDGSVDLEGVTLDANGDATLTTSVLTAGEHDSIVARYGGDNKYESSTSPAVSELVDCKALTVTAAPNTKTYDGTTTASAVPTINGGSLVGGDTACFTESYDTPDAGSNKTLTPAGSVNDGNGGGNYSVTFVPDTTTAEIDQVTTSTSLSASVNGASTNEFTFGQQVTFTASVTVSSGGLPSAGVCFEDVSANNTYTYLGEGAWNGQVFTLTTSSLTGGSHTITASYVPNNDDVSYSSSSIAEQVDPAPTTTSLTPSSAGVAIGSDLTITASVGPTSGGSSTGSVTPTGSVEFYENGCPLGSAALDGSGEATFGVTMTMTGYYAITAQYLGDTNYAGSPSGTVWAQFAYPTTIGLTASANPVGLGQPATVTAVVSSEAGGYASWPSGTVALYDGTPSDGTCLGSVDQCYWSYGFISVTFDVSGLILGDHALTATFSGDGADLPSTSTPLDEDVLQATTATLGSSAGPPGSGEIELTASVAPVISGLPLAPTGTVSFIDTASGLTLASAVPLSAGAANVDLVPPSDNGAIVAQYSGDSQFAPSTADNLAPTVVQSVSVLPDQFTYGAWWTVAAEVDRASSRQLWGGNLLRLC